MNPGIYNICIYQGTTYSKVFVWNAGLCCGQVTVGASPGPVDLTGYSVLMQFRQYALSPTILFDASPFIVLGGIAGTISLSIPATLTETFTWWNGVYDLQLTDSSSNVTTILKGNVTVQPSVSS